MFGCCLEHCLTFIGVQSVQSGCSSADLSEFICKDLLPYQGWAENATLRNTIVRLLLTTKADEFTLYTLKDNNSTSSIKSVASRKGTTSQTTSSGSCGGGRGGQAKRAALAAVNLTAATAATGSMQTPLTAAEAVERLDAGRVAWTTHDSGPSRLSDTEDSNTTTSSPFASSSSSLKDKGSNLKEELNTSETLFYIVPSRELRERVLGFPLRNEKQESVAQFIAENAVQGWEKLPSNAEFKARYKTHLVGCGLKWLLRGHKITLSYLYRKTTHEVLYRYFPHFALPLTEREKAEQPQWMSEAGLTSTQILYCNNNTSAASAAAEGSSYGLKNQHNFIPISVVQNRSCRRCNPLDHYFARKRLQDVSFPRVVFDLQLVRQLVQQSPERRLLMQDAVHAVFAAHHLDDARWEDFSKTERMHLRRLLDCAGLRIVVATLTLRGHRRELRLVMPAEDLKAELAGQGSQWAGGTTSGSNHGNSEGGSAAFPPAAAAGVVGVATVGQKCPSSGGDSDDEGRPSSAQSDLDGDVNDDDNGAGELADTAGRAWLKVRADTGLRRGSTGGAGGMEDEDEQDSGSDSHGESQKPPSIQEKGSHEGLHSTLTASAVVHPSTWQQQSEATAVLSVDPGQILEVQAAHEAERRPLALTAFVPRMRLSLTDKQRNKNYGLFMERYMRLRGTLETHYLLMKRTRVFMLVYAPRPVPAAALSVSSPLQHAPIVLKRESQGTTADAEESPEKGEKADNYADGNALLIAPYLAQSPTPQNIPSSLAEFFHFAPNDARLPKGVTAYSVNTVLDVLLQAEPHHAASLPRLAQVIDITTLQRRVLPLLRQLNYAYTTGFTPKGKKRIGLVVLRSLHDVAAITTRTRTTASSTPCVKREEEHGEEGVVEWETLDDGAKRAVLDAEAGVLATAAARPTALPSGKAVPSTLVLAAVPAMTDGVAHSTAAVGLLRAHSSATKAVNRIVAVRNGYARNAMQRVSRLHLELWMQHFLYPPGNEYEGSVRVCEMFERMTLSTYCVVVGLPQADLAGVLNLGQSNIANGTRNAVNPTISSSSTNVSSASGVWSTPIKSLPPSLYGWCVQQGMQMLCMCLTELQDRQLVRDTDNFQHLLNADLRDEVRYALCPSASVEGGYTYNFATSPPCASSSLYACMRYWLPQWSTVRMAQHGSEAALLSAELNPSVSQIIALCRVTRRDPGMMAAALYQNCGVPRGLHPSRRFSEMQHFNATDRALVERDKSGRVTLGTRAATRLSRRHREHDFLEQPYDHQDSAAAVASSTTGKRCGGNGVTAVATYSHYRHGQPMRKAARTEVGGATVADALEYAFHHFAPLQRVEEVVRLVLRTRAKHLSLHPLFAVPPVLTAVLRSGAGANSALAQVSWTGNACRTEFNTGNTAQGGAVYNRMLNLAAVHMGGLGEALRVVRQGQATSRLQRTAGGLTFSSSTESLKAEMESVFAPHAELPDAAAQPLPPSWFSTACPTTDANAGNALASFFSSIKPSASSAPAAAATAASASAEMAQQQARLAAEFEVVTDILRMILFSDQAHYRASTARALLSALNAEVLLARARSFLQRMPVFNRSRRHNFRVPCLSLVQSPYVLPPAALRGGPRPCANIAVLHHWTHAMEDIGCALSSRPARLRMDGQDTTLQALLNGDISNDGNNANLHKALNYDVFPCPLQLVHQPTMELARLANAPNVVRDDMTRLPLPRLAWPPNAVECEQRRRLAGERHATTNNRNGAHEESEEDERADGELTSAISCRKSSRRGRLMHTRQHRKHARTSSSRHDSAGAEDSTKSEGSESDYEDERAVQRVEAEATRQLYPARAIHNVGDPTYLHDLPIDGPPTPAEQDAVERCRKAFAEGQCASLCHLSSASAPLGITYPSIFHHVDGSFHQYMWQLVVHAVYRFILRVPGIGHADLEGRLMASGVLSQRAVRAVLQFLVDRQLLVWSEEELAENRCVGGAGVLGAAPRVRGPFQRDTALRMNEEETRNEHTKRAASAASSPAVKMAHAVNGVKGIGDSWTQRCYTAIAPLEALQFAVSAATW